MAIPTFKDSLRVLKEKFLQDPEVTQLLTAMEEEHVEMEEEKDRLEGEVNRLGADLDKRIAEEHEESFQVSVLALNGELVQISEARDEGTAFAFAQAERKRRPPEEWVLISQGEVVKAL